MLLQTAYCVIYDPSNPRVSMEVHLLLDSGNQKSYIMERAQNLLKLKPSGEQTLSFATFGSDRERARVCSIVDVGMCLKGYQPITLSLYVVPTICEPLVGQSFVKCIEQNTHLLGLDLAESFSNVSR